MDKLIETIRKNAMDQVQVRLREYKGKNYVDVRVFSAYDQADEYRPTKKGVSLNVEQLGELREALEAAEREAREVGLIK